MMSSVLNKLVFDVPTKCHKKEQVIFFFFNLASTELNKLFNGCYESRNISFGCLVISSLIVVKVGKKYTLNL